MSSDTLSPAQCRMARAALNWSQKDLAAATGVTRGTIQLFEAGRTDAHPRTRRDLRQKFEEEGVEFKGESWTRVPDNK